MNIGFEAATLRGRRTGIGNYCYNIILELSKANPELQFLSAEMFGWREISVREPILDASVRNLQTGFAARAKSNLRYIPGAQFFRRKLNENLLQLTCRSQAISLFHAFNYIPPFELAVPTLPVVYDLSFVRYPEMHPKERVRWLAKLPKVFERTALVHTISEFSKREIVEIFGYPQERIFVAYPSAAAHFGPLGESATLPDLKELNLTPDRYLLAVGTLEPRKNLKTLISGYSNLSASDRARFPLVVVGGKGWGKTDLPPNTSKLVSEGSIRFVGFAADSVLRSLYEGARLMLYPSIYEGFGMPVVEAMACGAPVAHSANTSMDEITGIFSARTPALDVDAWTRCMREKISVDKALNADERGKLIDRAHLFNWSDSAKIVRKAYDDVVRS
jgi:glycosyltransferase involved in cell wall biosynthesis